MKLTKTAGKQTIKMRKAEWLEIGKRAGWTKTADVLPIGENHPFNRSPDQFASFFKLRSAMNEYYMAAMPVVDGLKRAGDVPEAFRTERLSEALNGLHATINAFVNDRQMIQMARLDQGVLSKLKNIVWPMNFPNRIESGDSEASEFLHLNDIIFGAIGDLGDVIKGKQ